MNDNFNFLDEYDPSFWGTEKELHHYSPSWAEIQLRNWDKELDVDILIIKMEC